MKRERLVQKQGSGEDQRPGTISFGKKIPGWWTYVEEDKGSTCWNLPEELVNKIQELEDELEVLRAIGSKTPIQTSGELPNYTYSIVGEEALGCGFHCDEELITMAFLKSWGFSPEQMLKHLAERFPQEEVDA